MGKDMPNNPTGGEELRRQLEAARKYIEFLETYWGIPERLSYNRFTAKERKEYLASLPQEKKL